MGRPDNRQPANTVGNYMISAIIAASKKRRSHCPATEHADGRVPRKIRATSETEEVKMANGKKKDRELSEEDKQAIRDRIDKGERNSGKLAEEFGAGTQQVAGLMAWRLHRDSWG
jgi:hypothetical protein